VYVQVTCSTGANVRAKKRAGVVLYYGGNVTRMYVCGRMLYVCGRMYDCMYVETRTYVGCRRG
jgi:hypothetical protein